MFGCLSVETTEDNGRQEVFGLEQTGSLHVTRKVFSPAAGGFVRYLEFLQNTGSSDVSATVEIASYLRSEFNGTTRLLVDPANTGNTYAIMDNTQCCSPTLGFVFDNANSAVPITVADFAGLDTFRQNTFYRWEVTVPAGQTIVLMHFGIQATDQATATSLAQSLINFTAPGEFEAMSTSDRALIVNFGNVPIARKHSRALRQLAQSTTSRTQARGQR